MPDGFMYVDSPQYNSLWSFIGSFSSVYLG